jgi:uncharacterized protein
MLMFRKIILSLFLLVPVFAFAYSSPGNSSGLVNDFVSVLSAEQKTALENKLVSFEKETSHEIAVAIIKNLGGDTIENYAEELFKEWGIGKKNTDNGVLLLVAIEDREMRIEVGYGLEGALTDAETKWILDNSIAPFFKDGKYYEGIDAGVDKISEAIKGEVVSGNGIPKEIKGMIKDNLETIIFFVWILFIGLASILGRSKSWWAGGAVGGVIGVIVGLIKGFVIIGLISLAVLVPFGLLFDYFVSKSYQKAKSEGSKIPWWFGGGGFGGKGGSGFGGFGGGGSGGGGSSSRW